MDNITHLAMNTCILMGAITPRKYWSTGAIIEYLSDCAVAFGTRTPMLITSTKAVILIILSLVGPSSRGILSPAPPLALPHHFVQIRRWTYLD
jgi:hypothetical protein